MSSLRTISFDAVIIGGGGSGMSRTPTVPIWTQNSGYFKGFSNVHILFQLKVVLRVRLLAPIQMTIGGGTCTIP